ncbi:DNA-binding protein [Polaromonas sp. JS666]|uniref:DNA-binding protein n=1 Tax=Polaromonas sp. (strain JS666 / ATCC BAA-500) TaxID=296591 RepID=UPI000881DFBB|nr:DNA-binding protein [Polaromonas sp. JS666]SDM43002.1 replication region DNA-binding N-term [Polaromonas sp. JS666]
MQSKSTRGVQQDEVWAAADALIAAGERPTIERVRLKIGRGSPNTVSPMLETWFATLGPRLGVALAGAQVEEGAPKELRQALDKIWAATLASARDEADRALEPERDRLAQQGLKLDIARQELLQREAALTERGIALEHALELAKSQLRDQAAQLQKAGRDLAQARSSLANLIQERDAGRRQFDEQLRALAEERQRIEQRASANEKRLLEEVDRARQEAKYSARMLKETIERHEASRQELDATQTKLEERVHRADIDLATLRERIQASESLVIELRKAAHANQTSGVAKKKGLHGKATATRGAASSKRS